MPWVNKWGAESAPSTRVAYDALVGRKAIFHDDYGDVPDFKGQNMGRQRRAVIEGLCQVCGRFAPWSRRNLVLSGVSVEAVDFSGRQVAAVTEPWLDDRCAAIALQLCPALIRREHVEDLTLVPVRRQRDVSVLISVGRLDTDVLALTGKARAEFLAIRAGVGALAMWAKVLLLNHPIAFRD